MKQIQKILKKSYPHKLLATSIAAISTSLIMTSVVQASDIDIYQEAKSGQITLMFMLDISGSMGAPQLTNDAGACDAPSSNGSGSEDSTNGSPTYKRYYCNVTDTTRTYYYKRTGNRSNNYAYYRCGTSGSISQSDCITSISSSNMSTTDMSTTSSGSGSSTITYYYKDVTGATTKYYDRITRVKDGLFDLLYGNTTKGIIRLDDAKVIGLSTYSRPTSFNSSGAPLTADNTTGQVRIPARPLGTIVNGVSQRQILLNEIAQLGARGGTPTANAYAETAAYLFGTRTAGTTTVNIPKYFRYYPDVITTSGTTYSACGNASASGSTNSSNCTYTPTTAPTAATLASYTASTSSSTSGKVITYTTLYYTGSSSKKYYYKGVYTSTTSTGTTPYYQSCTAFTSSGCTTWGSTGTTNPATVPYSTSSCTVPVSGTSTTGNCVYENEDFKTSATDSGFENSYTDTKNTDQTFYKKPDSLQQSDEVKQCSGQGIYVLTDGAPNNNTSAQSLMKNALTAAKSSTLSCTDSDTGWDCMHKFVQNLLNTVNNPAGLKIRTAVVGFGSDFNNLSSFDRTKTQAQNIAALGTIDTDVKKAAYWGIIGEGGWYSGNSSQDIVNSVNSFLGDLNTDIPSVTTGSPTIPKDMLNPAVLQDDAYYQQFQPSPDKGYQLWAGNLKKYLVAESGKLEGRSGASVTDSKGRLITPTYDDSGKLLTATYDFWSTSIDSSSTIADADENTFGSKKFSAKGGAWSQLKLRTDTDGKVQRKLFTNRVATGTGTSATFGDGTSLRQINLDYLTDTTYQNDPDRGYLISLLGYVVDAANPSTITAASLNTAAELRQIGSVMHSLPVLVTNKGKVAYNSTTKKIESTNREDYVLFGTTQGLLQVVDAKTGQEKFAFVPNEMVDSQKQAFLNYTSTNGGMSNLYYGIDGPWALYTEYVIDSSGNLTVGTGKGTNQKGKQLAFGGLRMGGRSYYSLDLANISNPALKFHINPDAVTSGPLSYMGQSWSKPALGYVNWNGKRTLVMFVGGGYDTGYESDGYDQTNKKGAGIYMFSAEDSVDKNGNTIKAGTLLWWSSANANTSTGSTLPIGTNNENLKYSVVSEIRTVDRNGDDLIDHLYFGDLGGQLFRIDLDNNASSLTSFAKTPVRLLNLHENSGKSPRFYDMPGFSIYSNNGETFAVISIGSGNRSKPLVSYTTGAANTNNDAVYNIYDKDVAKKSLFTTGSSNTQNITRATLGKLTESNRYSDTTLIAPYGGKDGWYYEFDNCVAGIDGTKTGCSDYKLQSEKVFGTPLAMNYRLYVSTFDSSKPGLSGDCGAGVKGESLLSSFCLPYGQCKSSSVDDGGSRGAPIGIGIHNVTVGNCTGDNCGGGTSGGTGGGTGGGTDDGPVASASNYCASTGGRMAITVTGGVGKGEATQMCLIPQRWYERASLK
ncbi:MULTISPECIES: pilus assembly protein PilY [unclassified Acinetobacter]|uniref:pilus assembly protein PilY n=1 Tax=unclassified Acinetobacter TaxID=196816 RepID=UPI00190E518F|nr:MULTISPECIES: pilus assembly protein PilY [unclassified Acinetobacter]MBK0064782.1 pilus assembly protein PilY [Acinetobacter sp. S55]MBK0068145.1 pilus assembly protein PilY [Acinetobacter sp. S54]